MLRRERQSNRKVRLQCAGVLWAASSVLVALAGLAPSAWGLGDPLCTPDFRIQRAEITTKPYNIGNVAVDTRGSVLACDTQIFNPTNMNPYPGMDTQFVKLEITQPLGTQISAANQATPQLDGRYLGRLNVLLLTWDGFPPPTAVLQGPFSLILRVKIAGVGTPGACPANVRACIYGLEEVSHYAEVWLWVTGTGTAASPYVLTIGEIKKRGSGATIPVGLPRIEELFICGRFGTATGINCGSGNDTVIIRSGFEPNHGCANGNGIYSLVATRRRNNEKTAQLDVCKQRAEVKSFSQSVPAVQIRTSRD